MTRLALLLLFLSMAGSNIFAQTKQPNVIILLSDDQGWGDLSVNGNKNLSTPNIDKLAKNGVQFDRFYVQPVCSPTRAELLTGRYASRCGVYSTSEGGERINLDEITLASVFKKAGYATGAFGKWHNGMQYPYHPNAKGFEEFYGFCSGHWGDYFDTPLEHNGKIVKGQGFMTDDLTNKAMAFMEKNKSRPFLLYVPFNTPHSPMQVPDTWWAKFKDKPLEMTTNGEDPNFTRAALAMCENLDWNVGRIMQKLKQLNLEDNTIVIYFSDNGPNAIRWNGGMKSIKGSTDEGGVRSPLIMQFPKVIEAGSKITQISTAIDLLPTLTDLVGIKYESKKPLDGVSLKPLLTNKTQSWNDRLLFSYWNDRVSVRSQQYRLDHQNKLFDMTTDPEQKVDVSMNNVEVTNQLKLAVNEWKSAVLVGVKKDVRAFPIGHPDFKYTQLPARDAKPVGGIRRSSKHPNSSFFTNWKTTNDAIVWDVEVLEEGDFEAEVYYTCSPENIGSTFQLSLDNQQVTAKIIKAHNPPLRGMENDRVPRTESYVKEFKPIKIGKIYLNKGTGKLTLKALNVKGTEVMDFRLLMLKRVK
jgi:arylsulfatase A-like enzyme